MDVMINLNVNEMFQECKVITREKCQLKDDEDLLFSYKSQFSIPNKTIYLDGNSLGALPQRSADFAHDIIEKEWGKGLINSWNTENWWELPVYLGNKIAKIIGADINETVVTDTTSINLFKTIASALKIQEINNQDRKVIIVEKDSFPTDIYMLQGFIDLVGKNYEIDFINSPGELEEKLNHYTALVILSHVNYRTGYLYDMNSITNKIKENGALVIWDLCHSVGALPINLKEADADFAVGCTYKYLNGGPGSPAFLWVNPKYHNLVTQPLSGWWGHAKPFDMTSDYEPASGIRRYLSGTQPIISMKLIECGLDIFFKTDMEKIRAKSISLTELFISLMDQECKNLGCKLITPREIKYRGSHVSYYHPNAYGIIQELISKGIIGDYREPRVMRFGITPLYLSHIDIWDAVQNIKLILKDESWNKEKYKIRNAVT